MKTGDLIASAVSNTFRSKTRTILTVLAIFIGAFTLALTSGLGTGINRYIDDTVSGVGASDAMRVEKSPERDVTAPGTASSGPSEYDPDRVNNGMPGGSVVAMTAEDIDSIRQVEGVLDVDAIRSLSPDYIEAVSGTQYVIGVSSLVPAQTVVLATGAEPNDASSEPEVVIPVSYVEPLGFEDDADAVGSTVTIAVTDAERTQHLIDATIVGVAEDALVSPGGSSALLNSALSDALFDAQSTGLTVDQAERYLSATVWFDPEATEEDIEALTARLEDAGFTGTTVADQLGTVTTVIDGIVLVLNAFAIIALLAASFGIVNTLFMSVQERTREIGLMKAMGMGSGRVFSLFSLEAAFIGFLGSAIGVVLAMFAGTAISSALSTSLLAELPGLTLIAFDPVSIATIILIVMGIAFLAGTLPAARAARADPVQSLRYE
ncbi:putative ABC transport system permease protein [Microbacteriaceae bacterium SG_E_30_P1]|uniref:ABC transport system permease protein n=1 Tax=Antiquaquibacter oligotrophicus TaxID=2880260 RepID=A0ABT6KIX9_9MICO|nr:ABC transporter permease [Antiquaquibacter oligotrophicus]MDH6179856.1 putative ABC transport system permease protein [Antiquaquibacter oligotrophicus]UDF14383.1 ABC transporter permease [Antiquaquibacter oligotrophicus]